MTRKPFVCLSISTLVILFSVVIALITFAGTAIAQNPVPFVNQPLVPDAASPGAPSFTLTVNGAWFIPASVVNWNGSPRATTFISSSQLQATILASDIAAASTASVTVVNPSPGGGASNIQYLSITVPAASVSFQQSVAYGSGGSGGTSIAVADLNGDGKLDVVAANCIASGTASCAAEGVVGVLLGKGDGTFQSSVTYDSGGVGATSIAVADVNGDGKPDLIVANCGPSPTGRRSCQGGFELDGVVSVLLGNGDGTFQPAVSYDSGGVNASSVAVADVNGDGKLDIIVANYENFSGTGIIGVLLGNGDGTFQPATAYGGAALQGATWVAVADLNGDGKPDIAVAYECQLNCYPSAAIGVLLGNGDGTFQPAVIYPSGGAFSFSIVVADLNGDGKPDLIVSNFCPTSDPECGGLGSPDGTVGVLLGNGDGTFQAAVAYDSGGQYPNSVAVADVTGNGKPDLLVANNNSGTIGLLLGNGDGTFQAPAIYQAGYPGPDSVAVGDLTGEGRLDAVTGGRDPGMVSVALNRPCAAECSTTTSLTSSLNPSLYGQAVTLTATISSSHGSIPDGELVTFYKGSSATSSQLGTGTTVHGIATLTTSALAASKYDLMATYSGDANFASSSGSLHQTVQTDPTTTILTSGTNPSLYGVPVTLTAQVTSSGPILPTGRVMFLFGRTRLGAVELSSSGVATLTTSALGTGSITAVYGGDSTTAASTSPAVDQVVNGPYSTSTTLTTSPNPSTYHQLVTVTAVVTSNGPTPVGAVRFSGGAYGTAPLINGVATLSTSKMYTGGSFISAEYLGQDPWQKSRSQQVLQVVNQAPISVTLISTPNPSIWGQPVTVTANVDGPYGAPHAGEVTFTDDAGHTLGERPVSSATINPVHLPGGSVTITATYSGNQVFTGGSGSLIQTVNPAPTTVTIKSFENPSRPGQSVTFALTVLTAGGVPATTGTVTFTAGSTVLDTVPLKKNGVAEISAANLPTGATTITGSYSGATDFTPGSASLTQTISP
jgi:hypothetical protein